MTLLRSMCLCLVWALPAWAGQPQVGSPLPSVTIENLGVLTLEGEELSHSPWSSKSVIGRPTYLQHLAARVGLDNTYQPLSDELEERDYSAEELNSVAIVNRDDAAWGTGFIVEATLKANKRRYPDANIVVDSESTALGAWQLQPKNAALLIVDADGTVLFFKEGPLTAEEQASALTLLEAAIEASR